jgi:hypothetical protein
MDDSEKCRVCNWGEWSQHVLCELTRIANNQNNVIQSIADIKADVAGLKATARMWGALAGMVAAGAIAFFQWLAGNHQ